MRFVGVHRVFMLGAGVDASNEALGVWLRLQSYAGSDEVESPRLVGARTWGERRWLVACQLSAADVALAVDAGLARWDGDDLVVDGFDEDGLASVTSARTNGRKGGRPPKNPPVNPRDNPSDNRPVNPAETHGVTDGQTDRVTQAKPNPNPSETPLRSDPIRTLPGGDARPPAIPVVPGPPSPAPPPPEPPAAVAAPGPEPPSNERAKREVPAPPARERDPRHPRDSVGLLALFKRRWEAYSMVGSQGLKWPPGRWDDRDAANLAEKLSADPDPDAAWEQVIVAVETYLRIDKPFYAGHPFRLFIDELPALVTGEAAGLDRLRRTKPEWDAADRKHQRAASGTRESEPTPVASLVTPHTPWTPEEFAEAERLRKRKPPTQETGT